MQRTLERVIHIQPNPVFRQPDQSFAMHSEAVRAKLLHALGAWLDLDTKLQVSSKEAHSEWSKGHRRATATIWRAPDDLAIELFTLALVDETSAHAAEIALELGGSEAEGLWLHEVHTVEDPSNRPQAPDFMRTLEDFLCIDRDQNRTGVAFVTASDEVSKQRLIRKISAPWAERSLPVVVVTRRAGEPMVDTKRLASRLAGIARVTVLGKAFPWTKEEFLHFAYGGSVRLYGSGYRSDDSGFAHPFKPASEIGDMGPDALIEWALDWVAERTVPLSWEYPAITSALIAQENARASTIRADEEARQRADWEARLLAAMRDGEKTTAEEYDQILDEALARTKQLEAELDESRQEAEKLRVENRRLRWDIALAFSGPDAEEVEATYSFWPQLMLSSNAAEVYLELDSGIRQEVEEKIFAKVMDFNYLDSNADVIDSTEGKCMVCPRKRGAGGMRVILQCIGEDVRVLELFTNHDAYETFRDRLRQKPIDVSNYLAGGFSPWSTEPAPEYMLEDRNDGS